MIILQKKRKIYWRKLYHSQIVPFKSVDEILVCDQSNESCWTAHSFGTVCFWQFCKMKCFSSVLNLLELLGVKVLINYHYIIIYTSFSLSLSFLSNLTGGVEFLEFGPSNLKLMSVSSCTERIQNGIIKFTAGWLHTLRIELKQHNILVDKILKIKFRTVMWCYSCKYTQVHVYIAFLGPKFTRMVIGRVKYNLWRNWVSIELSHVISNL